MRIECYFRSGYVKWFEYELSSAMTQYPPMLFVNRFEIERWVLWVLEPHGLPDTYTLSQVSLGLPIYFVDDINESCYR